MFPLGDRDLELMQLDRGVEVDHTTIFRWTRFYAAELAKRIHPHLRVSNGSWRVDETNSRERDQATQSFLGVALVQASHPRIYFLPGAGHLRFDRWHCRHWNEITHLAPKHPIVTRSRDPLPGCRPRRQAT